MGGGGQTKEAKKAQTTFDQQYQPYVATGGQRSQETYDFGKGAYGDVGGFARELMSGEIGGGGGGGGAATYVPENLTPEQQADLEATYREYNTTGGWGEPRQTTFRGRAIGAAEAPWQQAARQLEQRQITGGGWGTGFNTANLAARREAEQARTGALLGSETEMQKAIDEGRKWGAGNLSEALKYRVGRQDTIGAAKVANENSARAAANAAANASLESRMAGARMLMQLPGLYNEAGLPYYQAQGSGIGGWGGLTSNLSQQRNPSTLGTIMGGLGAVSGAATPWLSLAKKKPAAEVNE